MKNICKPTFKDSLNRYVITFDGNMSHHDAQAEVKRLNAEMSKPVAEAVSTDPLEGLAELSKAQDAAYNEQHRYDNEFQRMMDDENNDGARSPRPLNKALIQNARDLAAKYPRAALYLKAQGYTLASNIDKYMAGQDAMKLIAAGGDLNEAEAILKNWCKNSYID